MRKKLLASAVCAVAFAGTTSTAAVAGEITGNGKWIAGSEAAPLNGRSECAFSGLNDNYVLGNPVPDADGFTRTQSWGQLDQATREFLTSIGVSPGTACNPTTS